MKRNNITNCSAGARIILTMPLVTRVNNVLGAQLVADLFGGYTTYHYITYTY